MGEVAITYVGPDESYSSTDPGDNGRYFVLERGVDTVEVSEQKAKQLKSDFADWFEFSEPNQEPIAEKPAKPLEELEVSADGPAELVVVEPKPRARKR